MVIAVLDTGDTAWMLISTALVMLMTVPGLALFYGGLVKRETVLNTLFLSFSAYAIVSIIWFIYGYPMVFGPDIHGFIGAPDDVRRDHRRVDLWRIDRTIKVRCMDALCSFVGHLRLPSHCTLGLGWWLARTAWRT